MNESHTSKTEMLRKKEAEENGIAELCMSCQVSGILTACALSGCRHFADSRSKEYRLKLLAKEINGKSPATKRVFTR